MREFECPHQDITSTSGVIEAFLLAFGPYRSRGEKIICKHLGVEKIEVGPDKFIPAHKMMAALAELQAQFGTGFMRKVGNFIFDKAVFPPGIDSVEKGMLLLDTAYQANHRNANGKIGGYHWAPSSARGGVMRCDNPYPCAFDLGIIETITRRFAPDGRVAHQTPGPCRHEGGDECSYLVSW